MKIAPCSLNEIAEWTKGKIALYNNNAHIQELVYDTRTLYVAPNSMFLAIKTAKRNGHDFIHEAYKKGIRNFLVDEKIDLAEQDANVVQVDNVLAALQRWAGRHRKSIKAPVIAITGSNGKTTLKEWLNHVLNAQFNIARSPKSFNSQLGVPLSLLQVEPSHKLVIIEAGISMPNEMDELAKIIQPDIAILTNVEKAHAVNFTGKQQQVHEKLKLAQQASVVIYCSDDDEINRQVQELPCKKVGWGFNHGDIRFAWQNGKLTLTRNGKTDDFILHANDAGSIQNICHILVCAYALGIEPSALTKQIAELTPVEMRFELKDGINNCKILNDTYSLDYHSFQLAVEYVCRNAGELSKTVIVSDFPELKTNIDAFYKEAAMFLNASGIQKLITIGGQVQTMKTHFQNQSFHFASTTDFLKHAKTVSFNNELILLKGSRESQFETITSFFDLKIHATYLKVDLAAIQHNLSYYQALLKPGTKTMVMVKALAYGSGSREISHLLEFNKVDYLAVAYADEGVELRNSGIRLPIMVMNPDRSTFGVLVKYNLEPELYNIHQLSDWIAFLRATNRKQFPVHIKLDTGMNRLGFKEEQMQHLIETIQQTNGLLDIKSIFSHLATADMETEREFTLKQIQQFDALSTKLMQALNISPMRHILNSPGIENFAAYAFDMVRLGIGLHGIASTSALQQHLQPVHTLVSRISHINHIHANETVGYARKGKTQQPRTIAVVPIGYADGYFRWFSNGNGKMMVNGCLVPVIGNVCMDMTMVDITDIPHTQIGDEVIVFGGDLPVTQVAEWIGTIPYELLTSVSTRVKRVYVDNV